MCQNGTIVLDPSARTMGGDDLSKLADPLPAAPDVKTCRGSIYAHFMRLVHITKLWRVYTEWSWPVIQCQETTARARHAGTVGAI